VHCEYAGKEQDEHSERILNFVFVGLHCEVPLLSLEGLRFIDNFEVNVGRAA
jgi:hypothetical protein